MNKVDVLIEGYAKVTPTGWEASGTTVLITADVMPSHSNVILGKHEVLTPESDMSDPGQASMTHSDKLYILADPGANRELLLQRLETKDLRPEDIDYVFLTHLHLDHSLLMGIFPKAKVINHEAITDGDKGEVVGETIPGTDIKIMKTPGHEYAAAILVVPTKDGTVVVAGDTFWFQEGQEPSYVKTSDGKQILDVNAPDDFAQDFGKLVESRKKILELADWVIPGHGTVIKNTK